MTALRQAIAVALIALMLLPVTSHANEVALKCVTSDGIKTPDLVINLAENWMSWGLLRFSILNHTDEYITAFSNTLRGKVGGELWLLHRATGEYWRSAVGVYCTDIECTSRRAMAVNYTGTCKRNIL
jgi:hypothetical protein